MHFKLSKSWEVTIYYLLAFTSRPVEKFFHFWFRNLISNYYNFCLFWNVALFCFITVFLMDRNNILPSSHLGVLYTIINYKYITKFVIKNISVWLYTLSNISFNITMIKVFTFQCCHNIIYIIIE